MPLKEFRDRNDVRWRVWDTTPQRIHTVSAAGQLLGAYQHGWLTFSSGQAVRRLAPVPPGWAELPDDELERLCAQAQEPRRRAAGETPTGAFKRTAEHAALAQERVGDTGETPVPPSAGARTFTDPTGREWRVVASETPADVGATAGPRSALRFISEDAILHLEHFPDDWSSHDDDGLVMLLRQARVAWVRDLDELSGPPPDQPHA